MAAETDVKVVLDLTAIVGALVGAGAALIAAWFSTRAGRRMDKERRTLELLVIFQRDIFPLQSRAEAALQHSKPAERNLDIARMIGSWFDVFAALLATHALDRALVDQAGLKGEMAAFLARAKASPSCPKRLNPSELWPNLSKLKKDR